MAQSTCVLLANEMNGDEFTPLYTGLDNVRFKNQVKPGDTFTTECEITKQRGPFYFASGKGFVDGKLCIKADFSFAIIKKEDVKDN